MARSGKVYQMYVPRPRRRFMVHLSMKAIVAASKAILAASSSAALASGGFADASGGGMKPFRNRKGFLGR